MPPANIVLESILGKAYAAMAMGKGNVNFALSAFQSASNADPDFLSLAQSTLNDLSKIDEKRCFVSKTRADFLRRALKQ